MICDYSPETKWPPEPYDQAQFEMEIYTAWWTGDADKLAEIYANRGYKRYNIAGMHDQDDYFFWGRSNSQGTRRRHVAAPASVARASADMLFATPPRFSVGAKDDNNKRLQGRIDQIFGADVFGATLSEAGEVASALGGVYLRPWWDQEVADHVIPSFVPANRAIPEFRLDRLVSVTFWTILTPPGDTPVVRHLEHHEPGKITHRVYVGTETTLGDKGNLEDYAATEWVARLEGVKDGVIHTGIKRLDVVYVPNIRPSRKWLDIPQLSRLGRSDFEGIEQDFDALDEVNSSWLRDVEDGKSRLFIDEQYVMEGRPGTGGAFDQDKHLFVKLQTGLGSATDDGTPVQDVKFPIRYQEHQETMAEIKSRIVEHAGISAQHLSDTPLAGAATATEVSSRNSVSESTRKKKVNFWQTALTEFVEIVMSLDAIHFATGLNLSDRPTVRFSAQLTQSDGERAQTIATKRSAGIISRETGIREANPDWTDAEILEELEKINADNLQETKLAFGKGIEDEDVEATEGMEEVDPADAMTESELGEGLAGLVEEEQDEPEYVEEEEV